MGWEAPISDRQDKTDLLVAGVGLIGGATLVAAWWLGYLPWLNDVLAYMIEGAARARH